MEFKKIDGFKHLGTKEGVCGGEPVIIGRRLKPEQIVAYGNIQEVMEEFKLTKEQVDECYLYVEKIKTDIATDL